MADAVAAGRGTHTKQNAHGRTPAQWYCYIAGAALLLAGILGFISDSSFDAGDELQGDSFLGFEVNGWHNLVHLASGLFLLAMAGKRRTAKTAALAFGVVYGIVTIIGLIDGNDVLGILPINGPDNVLHLLLSLLGIGAALVSDKDDRDHVGRGTGTGTGTARVGRARAHEVDSPAVRTG
ncbi:MAG: conserved hypothetical rane protein, partial [Solirubrobacterales bacterium]|nr:conserved hypothetical rane protein [Solirubrobacterales bacterium]